MTHQRFELPSARRAVAVQVRDEVDHRDVMSGMFRRAHDRRRARRQASTSSGASSQTRSPPDTPKGLTPKVAKTPLETSHVRVSIDDMTSHRPSKRTDARNDNNISPPVLVRTSGLAFLIEIP